MVDAFHLATIALRRFRPFHTNSFHDVESQCSVGTRTEADWSYLMNVGKMKWNRKKNGKNPMLWAVNWTIDTLQMTMSLTGLYRCTFFFLHLAIETAITRLYTHFSSHNTDKPLSISARDLMKLCAWIYKSTEAIGVCVLGWFIFFSLI